MDHELHPVKAAGVVFGRLCARVEEITFQSGEFTLVGDLRLPAGSGPFPTGLVLMLLGRCAAPAMKPVAVKAEAWDRVELEATK